MLRTIVAALALIGGALSAGGQPIAASPQGPAVLTVAGAVGESNRPAFDAFDDPLFKYHEQHFARAYAFDGAMLAALPQVEVSAMAENWPRPIRAKGPRLRDVLAAAGVAPGARITFVALDGYAVTMDQAARDAGDWVLATEADGKPLGLGGRGPLWLMRDTGGAAITKEAESQFVWALFLIAVE